MQTGLPDSSLPLSRDAALLMTTPTLDAGLPMWTATTGASPVLNPGNVVTIVTLTNSETGATINQEFRYDGTQAALERVVRTALAGLSDSSPAVTFVAPDTVLDLSEPVPPAAPAPTQAELDRAAFFADLRAARQQAKYDALSPDLQARCLPEYVDSL